MFESDAGSTMPSLANVNGPSAVETAATYSGAAVSRKGIMCWWFELVMLELDDGHSNVDQRPALALQCEKWNSRATCSSPRHVFVSALSS